ncbi:MAG TPA: FAD-dependent oxidoreductase [Pyrinomonadaceae bacterium]|jgi:phytoene dehydrogenase-like protein|nr:FAD-dependent oxidoreductase [Pyrinomonadaceae bacterium]
MAPRYEVVVVGGGIGGLTVAALLAARGVSTCVLERQPQVGGCIARVEFSGFEFEPGMGVYTSFGAGEIYERIFSELPVEVPHTSLFSQPYVVRLADGTDVRLIRDDGFFDELRAAFPECAAQAIEFYRVPAPERLNATSPRFQSFIEGQLRAFLHASIDQCDLATAMAALQRVRSPLYAIAGGPATLSERLAESIRLSGGTVRLNTPVLRLAYDTSGPAIGVDLLSGETVTARRAIVSNLTIWDTYGKLFGLNRTPPEIKKMLNAAQGSGAFVVYTTIEEAAVARLPGERLLAVTRPVEFAVTPPAGLEDEFTEFTLAVHGRTATLKTATDVREWFTYHASEEDFEESDQAALERFWTKLHAALPELGGDIEIIETTNPRTFYDQTRRKLGMVMGVQSAPLSAKIPFPKTILPNVFVVSDTVTGSPDLASVIEAAASLATHIKNL